MPEDFKTILIRELNLLFTLKKTERLWHIPVLASLCTGLPLLIGYYTGHIDFGVLSCLGGLVILYMPSTNLENRMLTLMLCSFGFIISFAVGISFSFNPYLSAGILGLFAFGLNWVTSYFKMHPPGSFFFIMIASMASCMPFDLVSVPTKIGLIAAGTILACVLAFFYSLYITKKLHKQVLKPSIRKQDYANLTESAIIGIFITLSLLVGHYFNFDNPYWIPVSCCAIMQGVSVTHVWQRSIHRITGTLIGIGFTWILIQFNFSLLEICIIILILQFIIEMLVVRHYGLAAIFFTPLSIFLAELGRGVVVFNSNGLVQARALDIVIGSLIGILGGMVLHNRYIQQKTIRQIRLTRVGLLRK
ncbi:FUSC family protein [Arcticibacter svalbardensis]|nr:FUSC family protein [Arcticibacter svalbardensis]